jgi:hypothetical protein
MLLCVQRQKKIVSNNTMKETHQFVGAFAELQKGTIHFIVSVHWSVRMGQLGSHQPDFL